MYKMVTFFVACVIGTTPPRWPRHRWVGMDVALEWFGLLEGCHRLWTQLFRLWVGLQRGKKVGPVMGPAGAAAPPLQVTDDDMKEVQAEGQRAGDVLQGVAVVAEADRTLGKAIDVKRQEQSNTRWKALQWTLEVHEYCLFAVVATMRLCLEPLRMVMDTYVVGSGHEADVERIREEAKHCKRKQPSGKSNVGRLLAGFHGDHTRDAWTELNHLMQSGARGEEDNDSFHNHARSSSFGL